jgi:hypothetical protein
LTTIALDRRFFEWRKGELSDPDLVLRWGLTKDLMPWDGVLARRRIVLLAEAGSGKTEEMREQARVRTATGQFAVYATVEDVDRDGLEGRSAQRIAHDLLIGGALIIPGGFLSTLSMKQNSGACASIVPSDGLRTEFLARNAGRISFFRAA